MSGKDSNDYMVSESGNWNVADQYVKNKIMKPLNLCDYYEDVAYFGYESIAEQLINYSVPSNDVIKIQAMERLIKELIRLIRNSKFALKIKGTRDEALKYQKQLELILPVIPNLMKTNHNRINHTKISKIKNTKLFEDLLDKVSEIKSKINEPLNKNHLIFTDREEFDPKKFKDNIKRRIKNQG